MNILGIPAHIIAAVIVLALFLFIIYYRIFFPETPILRSICKAFVGRAVDEANEKKLLLPVAEWGAKGFCELWP